ncbi:hypothetical protein L1987_59412 [Smallanthus sonchifolius]|uniref:Uncharacterized protein n=1 Tax=Smallanthus sonchifolius TaxID=185202 RepID=A0ACB9D5R4_9ASTR|nr:hypothetical protein L1987_59412 [Smallanthus sonchifolius]
MDTKDSMTMMQVNMDNNAYHHHHDHDHLPSYPFSSLPLVTEDVDQKTSLGFMELLGYQDYYSYPSSIFDETTAYDHLPPPPPSSLSVEKEMEMEIISTSAHHKEEFTTVDEVEEESSVVLNGHPSSPNSCSISSPAHQQCIKEKKTMGGDETKTKKKKKDKEPRFAFMTRTEMDHLDDGYRWRKYGQKAVKNSHFPRSYYRCTNASCNVKKRVERCMGDPSYVITTYEGKHNHPVVHNSAPLITSFNHLAAAAAAATGTPPGMLKLEQGGLLQDMLPCHH